MVKELFSVAPQYYDHQPNQPQQVAFGGYTHVIALQGGATLWAAVDGRTAQISSETVMDPDTHSTGGAIYLLDGEDGRELHQIPTKVETGPCTCLFGVNPSADQNEMEKSGPSFVWAGFADGTVQIFDGLIATPVSEGRFHDGAVLAFCSSINGRIFSAGEDGTLVRWNTETTCFEAMSKIVSGHTGAITGLCASRNGKFIFSSSDDGTLREYNVIDGRLRSVRVPPQRMFPDDEDEFGPTSFSPLRAVVNAGLVIVCGGDSGELFVWTNLPPDHELYAEKDENGEFNPGVDNNPLSTVPAPSSHNYCAVLSLFYDPALNHVWCGRGDGIAYCYVRTDTTLLVVNAIAVGQGVPVRCLHAFCCVDSTTTWTVGSDGMNFLWNSSRDRAGGQNENAALAMQSVAEKDEREIAKWTDALRKLNQTRLQRTKKLAAVMEMNYQRGIRLMVMSTWRRYKLWKLNCRMRLTFADQMQVCASTDLQYSSFVRWYLWSRLQHLIRLKEAFCKILNESAVSRPRALPLFVAKLQSFVCQIREAELRRNLLVVLRNAGRMGAALRAFRLWAAWTEKRREWMRREGLRQALCRCLSDGLLRRYYQKWFRFNQRKVDGRNRLLAAQALLSHTARGARRYWYNRWLDVLKKKQLRQRQQAIMAALSLDMDKARMIHAYVRWKRWQLFRKRELLEMRSGRIGDNNFQNSPEYQELQRLLIQKRENDDIEAEILRKRERMNHIRTQLAYGQRQTLDLEHALALAKALAEERKASMAEKMSSIIARMKAKLLNFSSDVGQIQLLADKAKTLESRKIFLDSHAVVKRVVVEMIKDPHHPTDKPWPLTKAHLAKIPSHYVSQLNNAIKTMIVTFDLMPRDQRMNLSSDQEIILNGEWLIEIAAIAAKAFVTKK